MKAFGRYGEGGQQAIAATSDDVLVVDAIAALLRHEATLNIEDFHYTDQDIQRTIVRLLKPADFDGLRVVIPAVATEHSTSRKRRTRSGAGSSTLHSELVGG